MGIKGCGIHFLLARGTGWHEIAYGMGNGGYGQ